MKAEHLPRLALDALWSISGTDRDIIFVMSSDTDVREKFRRLKPPIGSGRNTKPYSEVEMTVANVNTNGDLSRVTTNSNGASHPRFLFSYTSKRIPSDVVGQKVACVLVDDSVKITQERLDKVRTWRQQNDVPTIAYFTSDPLSDLYDIVKSDSIVWTWPLELLERAIDTDEHRRQGVSMLQNGYSPSSTKDRVSTQIVNRVNGVNVEINVPGGEKIEELFSSVQNEQYNFEKLVHRLDSDVLWKARSSIRYSIREFEELLAPIELSEVHSTGRSISVRLNQLDRYASIISSDPDAAPAVGTYRDVLTALNRLRDEWPAIPEDQKKEGQLVTHLMTIADSEESVAVVTPTERGTQAIATHLQAHYGHLYSQLGDDLHIHGPKSVRSATPVDHVLLYGAPRYGQRDLLRLSISPHLVVLAYPSELRLLRSQVNSLNEAFEDATEFPTWELAASATTTACESDQIHPSPERIDVTVPEEGNREKSSLVSDVDLRSGKGESDLADIVRTFDPDYLSPAQDPIRNQVNEPASEQTTSTTKCTILEVETGGKLYYRPTDEVSVLRADHQKILTKESRNVSIGDVVLHFEDSEEMRDELYGLIRERGDAQLAFYAGSWRALLEQAIKEKGDDLDDFIERVENHLNPDEYKVKQTYRRWYNIDVTRTRSKRSMRAMASAYELTFVEDNLDVVWNAVHEMENLYHKLKEAIEEHALRAATTGEYEDTVVSEHPRIQLSDFDIEHHLHQCTITGKATDKVPPYKIGTYDRP
ncbi:terminase large subunit domain-containing protein [Haloferax sp. ATB1]|uniref:DISARM anti-phage system protein DrmE domain-containing protein n=1 Tax=Haloferax sp. ATB1 TaxID=1508454 RepID=UPI000FE13F05|nr:terminase family protein [Haloferax sp. ATB1]